MADRRRRVLVLLGLLVVTGIASLVLHFETGRPRPVTRHPNVLLITVDALRADHLGCYGYRLDTSPNIDRWAGRGVRFADCTVQFPKTWHSIASLMTGRYPRSLGQGKARRFLPPSPTVLGELFRDAGYATGAVVANPSIGRRFHFDRGFGQFVESWQEKAKGEVGSIPDLSAPGAVKRYTDATIVTDQALQWLSQLAAARPFFLWLHYMDAHGPYDPPQRYAAYFAEKFPPSPVSLEEIPAYQLQRSVHTGTPIADLAHYRAQYDRDVRYVDDELGRLIGTLARLGLERSTLVVLTADHGESLGEHGYSLEHGEQPYQPCAHIPLVLFGDRLVPARVVVSRPVGLIDLSPTLLELAGIEIPPSFHGRSLVSVLRHGGGRWSGTTFMESGRSGDPERTVRSGPWKLVRAAHRDPRGQGTGCEVELYDLDSDPDEAHSLALERPEMVARLSRLLVEWERSVPVASTATTWPDAGLPDQKSVEMLRALGYAR